MDAAFAHRADTFHLHKDVAGLLVVPVERAIQCLFEEGEIQTDVGLRGGLPFDVVVTHLETAEAGRQYLTAVGAVDVVRRSVALTAVLGHTVVGFIDGIACRGGDILITRLTP